MKEKMQVNRRFLRILALLILAILVNFGCGPKYKWTKTDFALAGIFVVAQIGDGYTTDRIINDKDGEEMYPWAMGGEKNPSTEQIILCKTIQTGLVLGVAHIAPIINPKLRKAVLIAGTISAGYWTWHNWDELGND